MLTRPQSFKLSRKLSWKGQARKVGVTLLVLTSQAFISELKPPHTKTLWSLGWNLRVVILKSLRPLNSWVPTTHKTKSQKILRSQTKYLKIKTPPGTEPQNTDTWAQAARGEFLETQQG